MARTDDGQTAGHISQSTGRWVLVATILASSMAFIDSTALNVALPAIQEDLHASGVQLLWIANAYLLMLAALILVGGSLGDKKGRKKIFMIGITLFLAASLGCGISPNANVLIGARLIQGIGGAMMIPGSLAIITALFSRDERGSAIGTWSAAATMVTVVGPVLGGVLADAGLWRGIFLINLPLGIAALSVLYLKVPESRDTSGGDGIDYPGAILAALGLAGITYGFISAPDLGFADPRIYGTLGGGLIALVGFVVVESRSEHPMMPLHLFRSPTFSGTNLMTLFLYGGLSIAMFFLGLYLVQSRGYSQTQAGLAFLPFAVQLILFSRLIGKFADRYGARLPLIVGPAVTGVGFLLIGLLGLETTPATFWSTLFPGMTTFGIGMAITVAPLTSTVMGAVPQEHAGTASGVNNAVSRTAGALAIAIVGALALYLFSEHLDRNLARMAPGLPEAARQTILSGADRLGTTPIPASLPREQQSAVAGAIGTAFESVLWRVLMICAGLGVLSALTTAATVKESSEQAPNDRV